MKLAEDRFVKGQYGYLTCANDVAHFAPLYSYETGTALYDLAVIDGQEIVRVNGGAWSNRIDAWTRIHYAIKSHFGI